MAQWRKVTLTAEQGNSYYVSQGKDENNNVAWKKSEAALARDNNAAPTGRPIGKRRNKLNPPKRKTKRSSE
jgi:hypothetical protein